MKSRNLLSVSVAFFLFLMLVMSASADRCSSVSSISSISSISLLEIKAETHLVLQAFLHRTLDTPLKERPGRVGGAYIDHNKYR